MTKLERKSDILHGTYSWTHLNFSRMVWADEGKNQWYSLHQNQYFLNAFHRYNQNENETRNLQSNEIESPFFFAEIYDIENSSFQSEFLEPSFTFIFWIKYYMTMWFFIYCIII